VQDGALLTWVITLEVVEEVGATMEDLEDLNVMVIVMVGMAEEAPGMFPTKSSMARRLRRGVLYGLLDRTGSSMDLLT
jgi:hypothetical protein